MASLEEQPIIEDRSGGIALQDVAKVAPKPSVEDDCRDLRLHQAIKDNDLETAKKIIGEGDACRLIKNSDGELPLHLACKDDKYKEIVEALFTGCSQEMKEEQLKSENDIFGNTPLHVAAFLGNTEIVKALVKNCDETLIKFLLVKNQNKLGDTPFHGAAENNHLRILELMYEKEESCITAPGRFKGLPLHTACGYGNIEVVKQLVEWDKNLVTLEKESVPAKILAFTRTSEPKEMMDDEKKTFRKVIKGRRKEEQSEAPHHHYTPLTRACHFGRHEVVEFLLEKRAVRHRFALTKAIDGLHHQCVKLLLFKKPIPDEQRLLSIFKPRDTFRGVSIDNSSDDPRVFTNAFCELIKYMPDIAEMVLNYKGVKLEAFLVNSKNFKIKFHYEFVDSHSADSRKQTDHDSRRAENTSSTSTLENASSASTLENPCTTFSKETHPLSLMVKYKREDLLTHPVVAAFIHHKWRSPYGIFTMIHWFLYAVLYMICTNVLVISKLPNPSSDFCTQDYTTNQSIDSSSINTTAFVVMLYSIVRFVFEFLQFIASLCACSSQICCNNQKSLPATIKRLPATIKQTYIWDLTNWIEMILFSLSFAFAILVLISSSNDFCLSSGQRQMGAAIIWLSWIEFIFLSTHFQIIGIPAFMFLKILETFIKVVVPLALLLVFGFGLTFYFLVHDPNLMASPFSTPFYSSMKTLAMTVGDLGADDFFGFEFSSQSNNTSHLPHLELSISFWLLSLILMTILFSNLMIGLAVGDIQAVMKDANITKLKRQVDYLLTAETSYLFFKGFFKSLLCRKKQKGKSGMVFEFEPNNQSLWETVKKEFFYLIFGGTRYNSQESIERLITGKEKLKKLIDKCSTCGVHDDSQESMKKLITATEDQMKELTKTLKLISEKIDGTS